MTLERSRDTDKAHALRGVRRAQAQLAMRTG